MDLYNAVIQCFGLLIVFEGPVHAEALIAPLNASITENDPITLTCTLTGTNETATGFGWYLKRSSLIIFTVGIIMSSCQSVIVPINTSLYEYTCPNSRQSTWTIKKATRENHGDRYHCKIETSSGNQDSDYTFLNVEVPVSSVTMTVPATSVVNVRENTEEVFKCRTSGGRPAPVITWYKDSRTPGVSNDDVEVTLSTETFTSTVYDLIEVSSVLRYSPSRNDNGWRIYCTASNMPDMIPTISERKPILNVQLLKAINNNPLSVQCISSGEPSPSYKWTFTNRDTSDGQQLNISSIESEGKYTFDVQNIMKPLVGAGVTGRNASSIRVLMLYPPAIGELANRSVVEGSPVTVSCPVIVGNPPETTFEWRRNGQVLETTQEFTIATASRTDAMFYYCTVANSIQQTGEQPVSQPETKSFFLNVWYKTTVSSFYVEGHDGQSDVIVAEHDIDIQFTCVIDSNPASTVRIMLDGNVLKQESNTKSLSFLRSNVACLHGGVYTCEGSNSYGQPSSKSLSLFVKCSPRPLHRMKQNISSSLHAPVTLNFTALAYPEPGPTGFQWHKENGEEWAAVLSNVDLRITSSAIKSNLTILNVSKADYGRYRLNVTNSMGSYVQYLVLSEKGSSTTYSCNAETDSNCLILGIILGIVCAVLAVYAASLTILYRRKATSKDAPSTNMSTKPVTYVNLNVSESQGSRDEHKRDNADGANGDEDNTTRHYTDLVRYSNEDRTTYDVIRTGD